MRQDNAGALARAADYAWIAVFPTHSAGWYIRPAACRPAMMRPELGKGQLMNVRRALLIAACLMPGTIATAAAQFQPAAPQQQSPCVEQFSKLRDDAGKKAAAIRAASERKAPPAEACQLFTAFAASEGKMLKYAEDNAVWCGIPAPIIKSIKEAHAKTMGFRTKICDVAARPQRPAGPSLSDALSAPITDSNNIKTGRGTFDTLTGAPIGSR